MAEVASQYFAKFYKCRNLTNSGVPNIINNCLVIAKISNITPSFIVSNTVNNDVENYTLLNAPRQWFSYMTQLTSSIQGANRSITRAQINKLNNISSCHLIVVNINNLITYIEESQIKNADKKATFSRILRKLNLKRDGAKDGARIGADDDIIINDTIDTQISDIELQILYEVFNDLLETYNTNPEDNPDYYDTTNVLNNIPMHLVVNISKNILSVRQFYNLLLSANTIDTFNNNIIDVIFNNNESVRVSKTTSPTYSNVIGNTTDTNNDIPRYYASIYLMRKLPYERNDNEKLINYKLLAYQYIESQIFSGNKIDNFIIKYGYSGASRLPNITILNYYFAFYIKTAVLKDILLGKSVISASNRIFLSIVNNENSFLNKINKGIVHNMGSIGEIIDTISINNPLDIETLPRSLTDSMESLILEQLAIAPFQYQKQNIYWMSQLEAKIRNNELKFNSLYNYRNFMLANIVSDDHSAESQRYYFQKLTDYQNQYIDEMGTLKTQSEIMQTMSLPVSFNGGIIADDVGLGKTFQTVVHLLLNMDADEANGQFDANNLIIVPSRLIEQWIAEFTKYIKPAYAGRCRIFKIATIVDIKKLETVKPNEYNIYIMSANMLSNVNYYSYLNGAVSKKTRSVRPIISPPESDDDDEYDDAEALGIDKAIIEESKLLAAQNFVRRIPEALLRSDTTTITPIKKVIRTIIVDYSDFYMKYVAKAIMLETLSNSINIMKLNIKQKRSLIKHVEECLGISGAEGLPEAKAKLPEVPSKVAVVKKPFNIYEIRWNRILNDEGHAYIISTDRVSGNELIIAKNLMRLRANYKWILSATPLEKGMDNLEGIIEFLHSGVEYINPANIIKGMTPECLGQLVASIFRRNLKKSVSAEIKIPIFREEVIKLTQSSIERNIYLEAMRHNDITRLFKLCTHPLVSEHENISSSTTDILTLTEINDKLTKNFQNQRIELENTNKALQKRVDNSQNLLLPAVEKLQAYVAKNLIALGGSDVISSDTRDLFLANYRYHSIMSSSKDNIERLQSTNLYTIRETLMKTIKHSLSEELTEIEFLETIDTCMALYMPFTELYSQVERAYVLNIIAGHFETATRSEITKSSNQIADNETEMRRIDNVVATFNRTEYVKESANDPCAICFTDFREYLCLTTCRHIICDDCMSGIFAKGDNTTCPFCRTALRKCDINRVSLASLREGNGELPEVVNPDSFIQSEETKAKEQILQDDINKYGTKLANIIHKLNEILSDDASNRVIIFSQFDRMLEMIGTVLNIFKIKHVYIKGNVHVINKNIKLFKTDPNIRVVMLSSETCASGNNLTEATHIIFSNVLNSDANATRAIETQAIGRAVRLGQEKSVLVLRYMMVGTIEETYYDKNKYDIAELQAMD